MILNMQRFQIKIKHSMFPVYCSLEDCHIQDSYHTTLKYSSVHQNQEKAWDQNYMSWTRNGGLG